MRSGTAVAHFKGIFENRREGLNKATKNPGITDLWDENQLAVIPNMKNISNHWTEMFHSSSVNVLTAKMTQSTSNKVRFDCMCLSCTRVYPKVSGLDAWSENCKWYSSLPLGALMSLFCE
jgi:hypothetical protein